MTDDWPADYFASRAAFREMARQVKAELTAHTLSALGPDGEPLTVDTATLGLADAPHLIVVTSGVHGVEGHLGAAVQRAMFARLDSAGLPTDVRIALVHGVNAWGFAHGRRTDDANVDVNRNVVDRGAGVARSSPGYAALDALINPRQAPTRSGELRFWGRAIALIARERGLASLAGAIAEGQTCHPKGLFFAGTEPGEASLHLQSTLRDVSGMARRITHLDVHSGLGPSGVATLIARTDAGPAAGRAAWLAQHFGQAVRLDDADGNAYDARGTLARWYGDGGAGDARFVYLCVEIGTVNPLRVLSALKRENQAHHWAASGSVAHRRAKRALLAAFAPRSRRWRERSVAAALYTFERALALEPDE